MSLFQEEAEEVFGKKWVKVGGVIFIVLLIYIGISFFFSLWPFSVAKGLVAKVVNSESIIYNYQWYYDQYNAIQAQQINYDSMPNDAVEKNGLRMVLNTMIAEYNSKSKQITRNLWKASDLPYQISLVGGK